MREKPDSRVSVTHPIWAHIPGSAATDVATETANGDAMREEAKEYVVTEVAWGRVSGGREGVVTEDHMDITGPDS